MSSGVARFALLMAGVAALSGPVVAALSATQRSWYAAKLADNSARRYNVTAAAAFPEASDPVAETLVQWDRLRRDDLQPGFSEIANFLRQHRGWPLEAQLRRKAERLIDPATPFPDRIAYFTAFPPLTATAKFRYAEALLASGRRDEALRLVRQAWVSDGLTVGVEAELLGKFASMLTPADHYARADRLLWSGQTGSASRLGALVPPEKRAILETRMALQGDLGEAAVKIAALTPAERADPGVIVDQANWMRRAFLTLPARQLVANAVTPPGAPLDPVRWMKFRLELARGAAADGQYDLAYRIAANHRTFPLGRPLNSWSDSERDVLTDLEFLAGWTAMRSLGRPADAVAHFQNYRNAAKSALTQARGDYWAGRAADAAGDSATARRFFESAATHPDFFFGQLAGERLGRVAALPPQAPILISPAARQRFAGSEVVAAARILGELGDRTRQTIFIKQLVENADTLEEQKLLADFAPQIGRADLGVLVAREARNGGDLALIDAAYPRLAVGSGDFGSSPILAHAITRQESRFDRAAVSPANARGLMQLMPGTAREQAGKMGLPYDFDRLVTDEPYNVMLGSAYFQRLLDRWGGNVMLAVASYNAGAGNVSKWIAKNGDPRLPGADVVDWVEAIPFTETRIYVWRVLENAVMYDLIARNPGQNKLSAYLGKRQPG